ncbi:MAG: hypothetical protein RIS47_2030, partial [Bacteroidota bacterium]
MSIFKFFRYGVAILSSFLGGVFVAFSQSAVPTPQDCLGAIPICKNVYIEPSPYAYKNSGNGNYQNEILRLRNCYTEEFKGVWYTFTALTSGSFSFLLSAEKPDNEDYDWIMFDLTDVPCSVLATNPAPYMVSSNNFGDWANNKYTGADTDSVKSPPSGNCNGPGTFNGPNFNDDIMVTQGHTYVLYVSNWMDSDNGYVIDFSQSTAKIFDDKAPELKAMESLGSCADAKELKFSFSENVRCEDITPSKFVVTGPSGVVPIASATSNACKVGAPHDKVFTLGFASVLPEGNYTLSLAAEISDICGNKTASSSISFVVKYLKLDDVEVNPLKCMGVM